MLGVALWRPDRAVQNAPERQPTYRGVARRERVAVVRQSLLLLMFALVTGVFLPSRWSQLPY
jgi:hypothetical protein